MASLNRPPVACSVAPSTLLLLECAAASLIHLPRVCPVPAEACVLPLAWLVAQVQVLPRAARDSGRVIGDVPHQNARLALRAPSGQRRPPRLRRSD